jgi:hypothetical protein
VLICGECSAHNADGESFCGSCGAFLGWQAQGEDGGKKLSTAVPPREPQASPQTVTLPQIPVPTGGVKKDHPQEPASGRRRTAGSGPPEVGRTDRTAGHGHVASGQRTAPAGAATTEPVPTIDEEPAPVRPGELISSAPPKRRRYEATSPDAGPLVCPTCGTGNNAGGNFCRRCAASLRAPEPEAEPEPRLSWWTRLFGRTGHKALPAGTRPLSKSRHFPVRFVAFLAVLGVAGGVASANSDAISGAPPRILDEILNRHQKAVAEASAFTDGRKAELATDGRIDTFWATNLKSGERDNFLEAKFPGDIRLVYVFITGQPSKPVPPSGEKQPSKVLISVHHKGAKDGFYQDLFPVVDLPNDGRRHGFYVGADSVESVRLTIVEPKRTAANTVTVSLAEVQFTGR